MKINTELCVMSEDLSCSAQHRAPTQPAAIEMPPPSSPTTVVKNTNSTCNAPLTRLKTKPQSRFPAQTIELVSKLYWYSFFMTISTPLFRAMNRHWRGSSLLYNIAKLLLPIPFSEALEEYGVVAPGTNYAAEGDLIPGGGGERMVGIDRAFAIHAGFAFLWMTLGYFQICHAHKFHPKMHKYFGYVAAASFAAHCFGSSNLVYADTVRHTALPKLLLLCGVISTAAKFIIAIAVAIKKAPGWAQIHQDYMAMAYIVSLSGAGTIRTVAHLQIWFFNSGPIPCQNQHGGVASNCQAEYSNRLMLVAFLGTLFCGLYVNLRKDKALMKNYIKTLRGMFLQTFGLIGLSYLPGWEKMIHLIFGEPRSMQCNIVVLIGIAVMIMSGIAEYQVELSRAPKAKRI